MKPEDKELLIKDLCARLPYGIKASYYEVEEECETWNEIEGVTLGEDFGGYVEIGQYSLPIECIKPYLFPLSSMTEEEKSMYEGLMIGTDNISYMLDVVDWLNAHHFDYRDLIDKGLAIDATGLNIY